jgi:phosphinothricin acetyltransferase
MIAGVDSENRASLRFLRAFGFEPAGELREVGWKFGRYLTLNFLQYWITPPGEPPSAPNGEASKPEDAET